MRTSSLLLVATLSAMLLISSCGGTEDAASQEDINAAVQNVVSAFRSQFAACGYEASATVTIECEAASKDDIVKINNCAGYLYGIGCAEFDRLMDGAPTPPQCEILDRSCTVR